MKIRRSSKHTLKFATNQKREALAELMAEYARVCNLFIDMFWDKEFTRIDLTTSVTSSADSWLSARAKQCASREALAMVNGAKEKAKEAEEEPVKPCNKGNRMILSTQCALLQGGRNSFDLWVVLHSLGNKMKLSIPLRKHFHFHKFADWKRCSSVTITPDFVQISFEKETGPKKGSGTSVGIDVGINKLLATSDGALMGDRVKELISRIKRKAHGSNGQRRARSALSNYLRYTVKEFFLCHLELSLVVVERLKNMKQGKQPNRGKQFRKTLSSWNYRELLDCIQSHCQVNRVSFRSVNPYKTSQTCPSCSHAERGNRANEKFRCLRCGYSGDADVIGARNILARFLTGQYGAGFQAVG